MSSDDYCIVCSKSFENKITNCDNCLNFNCCEKCFIKSFVKYEGNINCPSCNHPKFLTRVSYDRYETLLENYLKIAKLENNEIVEILNEIMAEEDILINIDN